MGVELNALARNSLAVLALLFASLPCVAGGYKRTIQLRGTSFPNTLVILVDNSGSMSTGDVYACAVRQAMWVAEQASDGARLRFATFGESLVWERKEWTKLPDAEAVAISRAWLTQRGTGGNTYLADAVEGALALKESPLGVVVVSDCDPTEDREESRARIKAANAQREAPAIVGVISVAPSADSERFALLVAGDAGGPAVRLAPREAR